MSKRISIDIGLNASGVAKGAKSAETSLKSLENAVDNLGDDAGDAARGVDRLEHEIDSAGDEAGLTAREFSKLQDEMKQAQRGSLTAADALGNVGGAAEKTGGITRAMAMDVKQATNALVDFTSGRMAGGMNNLLGATTSLMQIMPGVGLGVVIASTLASEGFNALLGGLNAQEEAADRLRERLSGLYKEALEDGRDYLDLSQLIAESNDLRFNPERADEWKQLQADAKTLALDENTIIRANTGDLLAQQQVREQINSYLESDAAFTAKNVYGTRNQTDEAIALRDRWQQINDVTEEISANAEAARQANSKFFREAVANAEEAMVAVDELGNKLITLEDGTEIFVDVDTGLGRV